MTADDLDAQFAVITDARAIRAAAAGALPCTTGMGGSQTSEPRSHTKH
ncbi:hypothetical protein RCH17_002367 [Arthrobacter sp. MP_M7]|nr:hypothetical protein [Arthrobacter sp. MP_M4]MEC5203558.1 hypothetical protein [Arthrobacter sp. MP_M7]